MNELEKHPDVTRLVGHSLSGSIIQEIHNRNNQKILQLLIMPPL